MAVSLIGKLVVAISSRALFDLDASHAVFEEQGLEAYRHFQIAHEDEVLKPGEAFPLVCKLLALNQALPDSAPVEVVLVSRNSADTGLRIFRAIEHYGLRITRAAFAGGRSPYPYLHAFNAQLFLSTHAEDVRAALAQGLAAATILPSSGAHAEGSELRIAFDGDSVLFSDEAERVYQEQGLEAFIERERVAADQPLAGGPFKPFLQLLHSIQQGFAGGVCPIRTALVTARSAPAHERVVKTLRAWDIRIDESFFLGGMEKAEFLKAFAADIFFDDQEGHCRKAAPHVRVAHVPHGIINEPGRGESDRLSVKNEFDAEQQ